MHFRNFLKHREKFDVHKGEPADGSRFRDGIKSQRHNFKRRVLLVLLVLCCGHHHGHDLDYTLLMLMNPVPTYSTF